MAEWIPDQGDLIWLDFDPSSGREIMKRRPAFVLSRALLNEHTGMAIVAPVTSTIRGVKLEVVLPDALKSRGAVLVYQLKAVDFRQRGAELIEKTDAVTMRKVLDIAQALIS